MRARADAAGLPALAVTFDPHPVALLRPDKAPVPLVWPEREIALLEAAGATEVAVFRTGRWPLDLTAREFFDRVIRRQFAVRGMVEGPNFAFGHDRQGNVKNLGGWCTAAGIEFEVVEPISDHGQLISSSRIREALHEGKVEESSRFLGRPHRIRGVVTHGAGRGAGLGIPTINLDGIDTLIPLDGVYAARVFAPGEESQPVAWAAACNIGPNPTFGEQIRKVEAHLIGFDGDLYGRSVELDFLRGCVRPGPSPALTTCWARFALTSKERGRSAKHRTAAVCQSRQLPWRTSRRNPLFGEGLPTPPCLSPFSSGGKAPLSRAIFDSAGFVDGVTPAMASASGTVVSSKESHYLSYANSRQPANAGCALSATQRWHHRGGFVSCFWLGMA